MKRSGKHVRAIKPRYDYSQDFQYLILGQKFQPGLACYWSCLTTSKKCQILFCTCPVLLTQETIFFMKQSTDIPLEATAMSKCLLGLNDLV